MQSEDKEMGVQQHVKKKHKPGYGFLNMEKEISQLYSTNRIQIGTPE